MINNWIRDLLLSKQNKRILQADKQFIEFYIHSSPETRNFHHSTKKNIVNNFNEEMKKFTTLSKKRTILEIMIDVFIENMSL